MAWRSGSFLEMCIRDRDTAMKALAMIRSSGRLIGIISHVSELRGRIASRIEVTGDGAGFAQAAIKV